MDFNDENDEENSFNKVSVGRKRDQNAVYGKTICIMTKVTRIVF